MKLPIRWGLALSAVGLLIWGAWRPTDPAGRLRAAQREPVAASPDDLPQLAAEPEVDALCQQPASAGPVEYDPKLIQPLVDEARAKGNSRRGAMLFAAPHFACISCHRVGQQGGVTGPDLSNIGKMQTPEQIVESLLWPKRTVKPEYSAHLVLTADGKQHPY